MINTPDQRAVMAGAALEHVPRSIRETLLREQNFREKYGFQTDATILLGPSGVSVPRSALFDAVRGALSGGARAEVTDMEGQKWSVSVVPDDGGLPQPRLIRGEQQIDLIGYAILSNDSSTRIAALERAAAEVNLPRAVRATWHKVLEKRALVGDEVDSFHSDLRDTPVYAGQVIGDEWRRGSCRVSSLVPNSRHYFERLIGAYDGSSSTAEYAAVTGREFFKELLDWQVYEGLLLSLGVSGHSALTAEIPIEAVGEERLLQVFEHVHQHGDTLSKVGAIEVGLRTVGKMRSLELPLLRLVNQIRDDHAVAEESDIKMFSALFVLVDGELARTRLLSDTPPFYRRLASLAQAALIQRHVIDGGHYGNLASWALGVRSEQFHIQTLVDMRVAPRWTPELALPPQVRWEFFGRIMIAGNTYQDELMQGELRDAVLGVGDDTLSGLSGFLRPYYPGPLEGAEENGSALPDELVKAIEEQLNSDEVGPGSFVALVNSALVFRVSASHAELAAKALRIGNYTLSQLGSKSELVQVLCGLGTVAAVSRNRALADELRILVRRYRRDTQFRLSINEVIRTSLAASAAREEPTEWRQFLGDWWTELAFGELEDNEGEVLRSHLRTLLHSAPEAWATCARAEAALEALCEI